MKLACPLKVHNVGTADRVVRIILGLVLIGIGLLRYIPSPWHYLAVIIGIVLLFTGITAHCCVYGILGFSTLEKK